MIGLAISMSATGMILSHKANATTATGNPQATFANLPSPTDAETSVAKDATSSENSENTVATHNIADHSSKLASPTLKYEVQRGESVWQISKEFQVQPAAIAASNQLSRNASLATGQTINIPTTAPRRQSSSTLQALTVQTLPNASAPTVIPNAVSHSSVLVPPVVSSPVALASPVPSPETSATVSDVSQPIQVIPPPSPDIQGTLVPAARKAGVTSANIPSIAASPVPVRVAAANFDQPIPIAVPTPETNVIAPIKREIEVQSIPNNSTARNILPMALPPLQKSVSPSVNSTVAVNQSVTKIDNPPAPVALTPSVQNFDKPITITVMPPASTAKPPALESLRTVQASINNPTPKTLPVAPVAVEVPAPPTVLAADPEVQGQDHYQVRQGDTLNGIARQHGISSTAILQANKLSNPNLIKPNQRLIIPNRSEMAIAPNEEATFTPADNARPVVFQSSAPVQSNTNTVAVIPIAVESPTFTNQLKSDVARIQTTSRSFSSSLPQSIPVVAQSVGGDRLEGESEDINPEWRNEQTLPARMTAPQSTLNQLQQRYRPSVRNSRTSSSQIVGSAPVDPQEYNNGFRIPVGQEVSPNLPPLSIPEFPDAPPQFTGYIWPAKGVLTSGFGRRWGRMHKGIDIAAPIGTPIFAAAPGEVVSAGWNSGGYGNLVKIRHADGSVTYYGHNSRVLVREGQRVAQGEQIAEMGSTGRSTGPHLHFEVRPDGTGAVNPIAFLPQR
jgi:murein DD-endopeptidase MepM/ murein hydrolase activator NlpD